MNNGSKKNKTKAVNKMYYVLDTPAGLNRGFRREVYNLVDSPDNLRLVHYIGDHTLIEAFPHRNSKIKRGAYSQTLPSTLLAINESCSTNKDAHKVYKEAVNAQKSKF